MANKYKVEECLSKRPPHATYWKIYRREDVTKSFTTHVATFYDEEEVKEYLRI